MTNSRARSELASMPESVIGRAVLTVNAGSWQFTQDAVVRELHLELWTAGRRLARLACSPQDLAELATGFLFTHGVIAHAGQIAAISFGDEERDEAGIRLPGTADPTLRATIAFRETALVDRAFAQLAEVRFVASGCGQAPPTGEVPDPLTGGDSTATLPWASVPALGRLIQAASPVFGATGGVHAAALVGWEDVANLSRDGALAPLVVREDIGRHNTVDKVVGWCLRNAVSPAATVLVTTGRLSADLVHKAAAAGIRIVVSRSAPTDVAVEIAEAAGITLIGFARHDRFNVYSNWWRLRLT
jgi:FdhD protein